MKEIFKLILKYQFTIIFILLEIFAFSLVITHNNYQRTVFSGYMSSFMNSVSAIYINIHDYFHLKTNNQSLIEENIRLKNQIEEFKHLQQIVAADTIWKNIDSIDVNYLYKTAKMVNSSVNKTRNYITIDKGSIDGVRKEMAVSSNDGVVGIIEKVSKHYAKIIPLINTNLRVSAKIQKNGYYG